MSARPGARITLRYLATTPAAIKLQVLKGKKAIARKQAKAKTGTNQLRLRAPRKPGSYILALSGRDSAGQSAGARVRLKVLGPR